MAFVFDFTVTVCAPFSIESLLGAAKTDLSARVQTMLKHAQVGPAVLCTSQWLMHLLALGAV
jgi:hypothetical protein